MSVRELAPRRPLLDPGRVERVVVFRALHLGDFLCAVPALRELDRLYPDAEISLVGLPWTRNVVDRFPYIDRFLEFPGYWGLENVPWDGRRTREFLDDMVGYGYDLAVQMHGDGRLSNGFVAQFGARNSIGYRNVLRHRRSTLDLEIPFDEAQHEIERCLLAVRALGGEGEPRLEFPLLTRDREEVERVLAASGSEPGRRIVIVHPGASSETKRWPAEKFALVAERLAAAVSAQVAITGTSAELGVAQEVALRMRTRPMLLAGRTSIGGLAALISRSVLLVTNDSGPSHLAVAAGTPSVVLFGPSDPSRWAPLDKRLHRFVRAEDGEMSSIAVQRVVEESIELVS